MELEINSIYITHFCPHKNVYTYNNYMLKAYTKQRILQLHAKNVGMQIRSLFNYNKKQTFFNTCKNECKRKHVLSITFSSFLSSFSS